MALKDSITASKRAELRETLITVRSKLRVALSLARDRRARLVGSAVQAAAEPERRV